MTRSARTKHMAPVGRACAVERLESRQLLAADLPMVVERFTVNISPYEQLLVEQVNLTRANPAATAMRLEIDLNAGVSGSQLISADAKAPLAIRQSLVVAAGAHSQDMLDRDYFAHVSPDPSSASTPTSRAMAQGYSDPVGENIAVRSMAGDLTQEVLATHEQLFVSPGHRVNMLRTEFTDVGVGIRRGDFVFSNGSTLDSLMTTELFGIGSGGAITGVVFDDAVIQDDRYSVGEGIVNAVIEAIAGDGTVYRVHSGTSGGYTLDVPNGTYTLHVTGGGLSQEVTIANVQVVGRNTKVDVRPASSPDLNGGGAGNRTLSAEELRALDVSGDGQITPRDALLVLNYLIEQRSDYDPGLDVTGDGVIAPLDVLNVINYLSRYGSGAMATNQATLAYFPSLDPQADAADPIPWDSVAAALDTAADKRHPAWWPVVSLAKVEPSAVDVLLSEV